MSSLCSLTPTSPEHHTPLGLTHHYGSSLAEVGPGHTPPPPPRPRPPLELTEPACGH